MLITNHEERIKYFDRRIRKALADGSSTGFIIGLMKHRNREVVVAILMKKWKEEK